VRDSSSRPERPVAPEDEHVRRLLQMDWSLGRNHRLEAWRASFLESVGTARCSDAERHRANNHLTSAFTYAYLLSDSHVCDEERNDLLTRIVQALEDARACLQGDSPPPRPDPERARRR